MRRGGVLFALICLVLIVLLLIGCAAAVETSTAPIIPITLTPNVSFTNVPMSPNLFRLDADLVIQSFKILEYDWLILGGFEASAEVVVRNVGEGPASSFAVGIVGVNRQEKLVRFSFSYDPALTIELASGQEVTLTGKTGLSWHGHFDVTCADENYDPASCAMRDENNLWLMAIADDCEGDGVPDICAVDEIDETNNTSAVVVIEKTE